MELTQEYFDKALKTALAPLATKNDVRSAVEDLARIVSETLAAPMAERFDRLEEMLAVKEDVQKLKTQMAEIRSVAAQPRLKSGSLN